jgi:hypothetical protein
MDRHIKTQGKFRAYHLPRTAFAIERGTVNYDAISIDGVLQLKASKLLNGYGVLSCLTQNFHDFRDNLVEPD